MRGSTIKSHNIAFSNIVLRYRVYDESLIVVTLMLQGIVTMCQVLETLRRRRGCDGFT